MEDRVKTRQPFKLAGLSRQFRLVLDSIDLPICYYDADLVIHFVNRHPGIRVADLLDILKITKQSLGRVLKQLVDTGFIDQRPGPVDRRQRLLYPTEAGRALALRLRDPQVKRIAEALAQMSPEERRGAERFLRMMVNTGEREKVTRLIER